MNRIRVRALGYLSLIAILLSSSGCRLFQWTREQPEPAPIMFNETPQLGEIIEKINRNTAMVRQLEADDVRITTPGAPTLRGRLSIETPSRLRLRADVLLSRELDIGSNDDVFWIWTKSGGGALLYSRHDEFAQSRAQQLLPINPRWLLDALGLVTFDASAQHAGPYQHGAEYMQIRSQMITPKGEAQTKVTVIHMAYGWVVEQHILDAMGHEVASAIARKHRYYPEIGVSLPEIVDVQLTSAQQPPLSLQIDVGTYRINQLNQPEPDLWVMPTMEGYPHINIADPRSMQQIRPAAATENRVGYRPQYRGYSTR